MKRSTDRRWSPAEIRQNQKEHYAGMAEHPPDQCGLPPSGIPELYSGGCTEKVGSRYEERSGCRWSDWKKIM